MTMKRGHGSGRLAGDGDGVFPDPPPAGNREVTCTGSSGATSKPALLEPCASAMDCPVLLSSTLHADLKLAELDALFAADPLAILATKAIDFAAPGPASRILPPGLALRVPVPCACSSGVRKATSVRYVSRPGDTLSRVYGGLTAPDWIRDSNGGVLDADGAVNVGTALLVPLHCVCCNAVPAVYLTYVVDKGDTVPAIVKRYQTTVTDVMSGRGSGRLAGYGDGTFLDKLE
ncbi:lysM domain-containing GPI-anchored protein LYP4-like [Triticum aestivum]|uniref:lysM domain-containing GPI-anchored protein LYP4-like n=1 Tax=Triticum aestivum TaxID=4565 RepID=UPI001D023BA5|nr:lysM domain-containing GPI-anchored protein LYP4-like [Triticum aestivum]